LKEWQRIKDREVPEVPAFQQAIQSVITRQSRRTTIPKRYSIPIREIWELQLRLPARQGQRAATLLEHPRFRAAFDLLLIREASGETEPGLGQWWHDYQEADPIQRQEMVAALSGKASAGKRRRKRKRSPKLRQANA
jgi:poly(A) polymerase